MSPIFRFSELAQRMQPSPIRELFQMIRQPGMISFAGGLPDPAAFPVGPFADCADVLSRDGRQVLQYGASEGYPQLRTVLLEMMTGRLGYDAAAEELEPADHDRTALPAAEAESPPVGGHRIERHRVVGRVQFARHHDLFAPADLPHIEAKFCFEFRGTNATHDH